MRDKQTGLWSGTPGQASEGEDQIGTNAIHQDGTNPFVVGDD